MKNILVPTDFSENASEALIFAADIASRMGAGIIMLHALSGKEKEEHAIGQMKALENWLMKRIRNKISLSSVIAETALGQAVKSVEKRKNIDLIVMSTGGASSLKKTFFGSNASRVIEQARTPVLAVPAGMRIRPIVNIAYATDYTMPDEPVVKNVIGFAELFAANLIFLHVIGKYEVNAIDKGREYISFIKNKASYPKISYHFVQANDIVEGISGFVSENKIDVLTMATHHKGVFEILMNGSVTNTLLNEMIVPLLVHHKRVYEKA